MAYSQQRVMRLPLTMINSYLSWNDAEDYIWANRLVIIGAHILNFCYGDDRTDDLGNGSQKSYTELVTMRNEWLSHRPSSFSPILISEPPDLAPTSSEKDPDILTRVWHTEDHHIVAAQTLGLLDILLAAYSPHIPRVGLSRKEEMERTDTRIKQIVLEICGVAISNRQSPPAGLVACMAINICADRFTERGVQWALMGVVRSTISESNYWPSRGFQRGLRGVWGWGCDEG
ncbi:hypothetical protein BJY04DRAFT_220764 [Aspergillus karnatakaensis]|uniref:uncharacterized protein n=1 Tax=Aspergillus karnatakaensis TaxID=1810916 RepID=UPI003CCDD523